MGKFLELLNKKLKIAEKPDYVREQFQSYMTGPEWRNVEMAEELGKFVKEGNSMFRFPYFRQIVDLWQVIYKSYSSATKHSPRKAILSSEYMFMDIFIGVFTTVELMPKGVVSLFFSLFLQAKNNTEIQSQLAQYFTQYANDLQTIPFYDQKYNEIRARLAEGYRSVSTKTWGDWFSWKFLSMELFARHWISKPLSAWYHSETNIVPATTDVLVKFNTESAVDPEVAQQEFLSKLNEIKDKITIVRKSAYDKQVKDSTENLHVYVKSNNEEKKYTSVYALLRTHRYAAFQEDLKSLSQRGIQVKKIAGQHNIQVKCEITESSKSSVELRQKELLQVPNTRFLYSYGDRVNANRRICLFDTPVKELQQTVNKLNEHENVQVKFIHNF
ncbi:Uncharacterised protein [Legionella busanensis]|uniref:Uncharacterized protein n=1 Tax=Legionella busanensis TaxID=190655 RepID=A0A378JJP8_9GAMM|nr:hypothetical protein [Legionella busanensis]STX51287.1 Uncharacterised protein [Legionella busanensis]